MTHSSREHIGLRPLQFRPLSFTPTQDPKATALKMLVWIFHASMYVAQYWAFMYV